MARIIEGSGNKNSRGDADSYYDKLKKKQQAATKTSSVSTATTKDLLTNRPAKESYGELWRRLNKTMEAGVNKIMKLGDRYQNYAYNQPSSNSAYAARYGGGKSFTPTGQQYAMPAAGYKTGTYTGQFGSLAKPYTYGQTMQQSDYQALSDQNVQRLLDIISRNIVNKQSNAVTDTTSGGDQLNETINDVQQSRDAAEFNIPPGVLPDQNANQDQNQQQLMGWNYGPMFYPSGGGYGGGGGGYGGYRYPRYSSGGSNDNASKWYERMVNWKIRRNKNG